MKKRKVSIPKGPILNKNGQGIKDAIRKAFTYEYNECVWRRW